MDSNHRKLALTGLQPVPFSHSGTDPYSRLAFYKAHPRLCKKIKGLPLTSNCLASRNGKCRSIPGKIGATGLEPATS